MRRETRHSRVELTEDLYREISDAWGEKQDVEHVAEATGLLWSTVRAVVDHGIPELMLPPLNKSNGNGKVKKKRRTRSQIEDENLQKAAVIAHKEATEHIAKAKAAIKAVEKKALETGTEIDLAEQKQLLDGTMTELKVATKRVNLEEKRLNVLEKRAVTADATKRSAEEAALARQSMNMCLNVGAVMSRTIDALMEGIEEGNIQLPNTVDIKTLSTLASSADRLTSAIERAIKIEKGRAGEPDAILGVKIGLMLNQYSDSELDTIIETGSVPVTTIIDADDN